MANLFQRLIGLLSRRQEEPEYYDEQQYDEEEYEDDLHPPLVSGNGERQLFTALDIGTAYAKAIIIEVHGDHAQVLGVGRHPQSYAHMSDGIVTDIPGVISNCNEALIKAEQSAGGVIAPQAVIGIAGELVKGSSTTVSRLRQQPS